MSGRTPWARAPGPGSQLNPQLFSGQLNPQQLAAALGGQQVSGFPGAGGGAGQASMLQQNLQGLSGLSGLAQNLVQFSQQQAVQQLNPATVARPQISQPMMVQQHSQLQPQLHQQQQLAAAAAAAQAAQAAQSQGLASHAPQGMASQGLAAQAQAQAQGQNRNQRAFVGHVTKLQDNYGFVDDDVFFQTSVVKGALPRVGDRVMVEANFNPNMPFKWNAFRIQLIPENTPVTQAPSTPSVGSTRTSDRWGPPTNSSGPMSQSGGGLGGGSGRDSGRGPSTFGSHVTGGGGGGRDRSPARRRTPPRRERTPPRRASPPPRRRSPSPRRARDSSVASKDRAHSKDRARSPKIARRASPAPSHDRHASTTRDRSPAPKKRRVVPRYQVALPKHSLMAPDGGCVVDLKRRFPNLYIPSDFFLSSPVWLGTLPMERSLSLETAAGAHFHVTHKDVDGLGAEGGASAVLDPADADSRYVAKVMLLAGPGGPELLGKTVGVRGEDGKWDEEHEPAHLHKTLSFLVGLRGKSEVLALGGAYSPSLDGPDPDTNPRTLINTAIRTTKALTGIDLSACTQWYKFVELAYRRVDKSGVVGSSGSSESGAPVAASFACAPASSLVAASAVANAAAALGPTKRLDRTVVFVPDVWSASPTKLEWERTTAALKAQLTAKLAALDMPPPVPASAPTAAPAVATVTLDESPEKASSKPFRNVGHSGDLKEGSESSGTVEKTAEELAEGTPTPWALLDVKAMKVADLRVELEARGLDVKGVKAVLSTRLQEALDKEMAEDEAKEEADAAAAKVADDKAKADAKDGTNGDASADDKKEEKKELTEKEKAKLKEKEDKERKEKKAALERHFNLAALEKAPPGILVHPNRQAKGGKFDCKLMSLSSLLDYRVEDSKEHSFEVSLFAEMFAEMLQRDGAFRVLKSLLAAPDREAEKKEKEAAEKAAKEAEDAAKAAADKPAENGDAAKDKVDDSAKDAEKKDDKKEDTPKKDASAESKKRKRSKSPEKKEEKTIQVKDPVLLMSYAHFDTNLCGYLYERDAEEILHFLGLGLSRAQVSRLIKRQMSRGDTFNYRKLTDTVVVEGSGEVKAQPDLLPIPSDSDIVGGSLFRAQDEPKAPAKSSSTAQPAASEDGQVFFQGSLIDVAQLLGQMRRLEKEEKGMEVRNAGLEKDLKSTKDSVASLEKKKRRLEEELDKCKKRMYDAEKCLKTSVDDTVGLKTCLNECKKMGERMSAMVEKALPTPKDDSPPKKSSSKTKKDEGAKKEAKEEDGKGEEEAMSGELTVKEDLEEDVMDQTPAPAPTAATPAKAAPAPATTAADAPATTETAAPATNGAETTASEAPAAKA